MIRVKAPVTINSGREGFLYAFLRYPQSQYQHTRHFHQYTGILGGVQSSSLITRCWPVVQWHTSKDLRFQSRWYNSGKGKFVPSDPPIVRHHKGAPQPHTQAGERSPSVSRSIPTSNAAAKSGHQNVAQADAQQRSSPASATARRLTVRPAAGINKSQGGAHGPKHRVLDDFLIPGDSQTLQLSGGGKIGFADIGCQVDYTQVGLLFHPQYGGRLHWLFLSAWAEKHRIRLICPDRPSYGETTCHPNLRTVQDIMPDIMPDIKQLLDYARVDKFKIIGWRAGGAYALAAAQYFGKRRVLGTAIICGLPAPDFAPESVNFWARVFNIVRTIIRRLPVIPLLSSRWRRLLLRKRPPFYNEIFQGKGLSKAAKLKKYELSQDSSFEKFTSE